MGYGRLKGAVAAAFLLIGPTQALAECNPAELDLTGGFGSARFAVAVADSPESRAQGLMHVPQMDRFAGMLFVYDHPQRVAFWMKNTLIPLDMIFADAAGQITHIHPNAIPGDLTAIPGGDSVQYVLELNAGMAARLGLRIGDQLRHDAIGPDANWPCRAKTVQ